MYTFDANDGKWDYYNRRYVYPEGPSKVSQEKGNFIEGMNTGHELWSQSLLNAGENKVITETSLDNAFTFQKKKVGFKSHLRSIVIGENPENREVEDIDDQDRNNRISFNFSKMLAYFVEKAWNEELRGKFFDRGSIGEQWGNNKEMMRSFKDLFESGLRKKKIGLTDQSIKDYPRHHFERAYEVYQEFMKQKSSLRVEATPFYPGTTYLAKTTVLARSAPKTICGVYQVPEKTELPLKSAGPPPKPAGPPPPRRPSTAKRKMDAESRLTELEQRIQKLILLSEQPVCIATPL
jgi:hypothetical protein